MKITLVVPVFNEEKAIPLFYDAVCALKGDLPGHTVEILFINDGSTDATEEILGELSSRVSHVTCVNFSRNFGKESALMAGIDHFAGDAAIPIDVDLQDPMDLIPEMVRLWEQGAKVVLPVRMDRAADSFLKRYCAGLFYKIHNKVSSPKIEENAGDFRLLDKDVCNALRLLQERHLFMKGLFAWAGFTPVVIPFTRAKRSAGESKFTFWKLWNFALEGITSFSTLPLRMWSYIGFAIAGLSFCYGVIVVAKKILFGDPVTGYASLMVAILFLGGINLMGIGILGEYLGRTYMETKQRPRYVIKSIVTKHRGTTS